MAKFHGFIGFANTTETAPGVYTESISEVEYTGNVLRDVRQWDGNQQLNDDLSLSSRISIIADPFALANIPTIKYVKWLGVKWRVTSIEQEHPRLHLRLGEVYNG